MLLRLKLGAADGPPVEPPNIPGIPARAARRAKKALPSDDDGMPGRSKASAARPAMATPPLRTAVITFFVLWAGAEAVGGAYRQES